jgi:uncharacterized protein YecE (DUF72 family)
MLRIGTSGWVYDHWQGTFYPDGVTGDEMLPFFAEHFDTVEINNTFYNLPSEGAVENWRDLVPDGFLFAVKASRYITHMKNLLEPEEPLSTFLSRVGLLEDKLGPILFQLPPRWNVNVDRLRDFSRHLPEHQRYTFEFRDQSWYSDEVFALLEEEGYALCLHDDPDAPAPERITAGWTYVRFHGRRKGHDARYSEEEMAAWAEKVTSWADEGLDVYCYFNNDVAGYALENARQLKEMAGQG